MQRLVNFDVSIQPRTSGYYTCVATSSAGEARADFAFPFSDQDLQILVLQVLASVGRIRRRARRIQSQERQLLEDFGGQLFQAVFSGAVRNFLDRSLAAAESKNTGLRIRLRLPPELANIPWEYLYDRESAGFVSLSPETALVRYVEMPRPPRPFPISPPLRILTMISAPSDVPELQGDDEWDKLNASLTDLIDRGMVQADRLEAGTLAALQRPLRRRDYHVLHFVGHGMYDENAQDGALALEARDGRTRLVTGRDLGMMLKGHPSLRLVVLNACEGARSARDDPFGGVAQALVRQGIPAVIAMQFEISDPAALVFSHSFYQAIADGLPLDLAMVEARKTMFAEGNEVEWATPVLYLRSPNGQVFIKGRTPKADRQAQEEAEREAREEADRQAKQKAEQEARERRAREEAERQAALEEAGATVTVKQDEFDVFLEVAGDRRIQVIKEVRSLTGLGLNEAKDLVDGAPKLLLERVSKETADKARAALEGAGATVMFKTYLEGAGATVTVKQDEFDVFLEVAGDRRIQAIREVRSLTGLGLKEAVDLVDGAPKLLLERVSKETADKARAALEGAGATVMFKTYLEGAGATVTVKQDEFDVILEAAGDKKILVLKEVRSLTGLGLNEAKDLVDGAPKLLLERVSKETADKARAALEGAGATVTVN